MSARLATRQVPPPTDASPVLDEIVQFPCDNKGAIDAAIKAFFSATERYAPLFMQTDQDWAHCAFKLLYGPLFRSHKGYVRLRMFERLKNECSTARLVLVATVLLYDSRDSNRVFGLMQERGLFPRLVELVRAGRERDSLMWRICLELLYEMIRIQKLNDESLGKWHGTMSSGHS